MDLVDRMRDALAPPAAAGVGDGLVVAFSGGPDSTALLDLAVRAARRPGRIVAAHLDHGMRPESRAEAARAAAFARALGVPLATRRIEVPSLPSRSALGSEAAAREARYAFLEEVARAEGFGLVATGHHRDDQAETVFLRLVRGSGPRGLRAIAARRPIRPGSSVSLVRPLLGVPRAEILAYVRRRGLPACEDPTNTDGSNLRSLVRTRVLPRIAARVDRLAERLAAVAALASSLPRAPTGRPPSVRPGVDPPAPAFTLLLACPGAVRLPDGSRVAARSEPGAEVRPDARREVLDAQRAPPPYVVRPARPGDRFRPLGLGSETTVFRFLMNQGVGRGERGATPVVTAGGRVVWVVGHRIDETAKITAATRRRTVLEHRP